MDLVKNFINFNENQDQNQERSQSEEQGQSRQDHGRERENSGFLGGLGDKLNSAAGGGRESEKNEDMLDKGPFHPQPYPSHPIKKVQSSNQKMEIQELMLYKNMY